MQLTDVRKIRVGDVTPWGAAGPICDANPANGRWACATHDVESFADQAAFTAHRLEPGPHDVVWRCLEHGRPEGFRR